MAFIALALVFAAAVAIAVVIATSTSNSIVHARNVVGNDVNSVVNDFKNLIGANTK
jgi:hypothetical protein